MIKAHGAWGHYTTRHIASYLCVYSLLHNTLNKMDDCMGKVTCLEYLLHKTLNLKQNTPP